MDPRTEQLIENALQLPDGDRLEVAEAVFASLRPQDRPPFDAAWAEVVRRRSAELRTGEVVPVTWSEIKAQIADHASG